MRFPLNVVMCALLVACSATARSSRAEAPLDEIAGVLLVCSSTPSAAVARAERLRGAAEIAGAAISPNPALVATHQRAFTGPTDTETVIGVSVPLSVSGQRSLTRSVARVRREQADADAHLTLFEAALAFREAYVTALVDRARLEVATQQADALARLSRTIRALEQRGEAAGYDILRQETQAKLHRRTVDSLRARAARSSARLAVWTGSEVTPSEVPLESLAGGSRAAKAGLAATPPRVRSMTLAGKAARAEARAARRRWVPDLEVFAGYRATDLETETGHGISVGVTVPLTFFDHGQGEAARADAEATLFEARVAMLRQTQHAELRSSVAELAMLEPGAREAEQVVQDTRQLQARAEQLYIAGEASLTELLDAYGTAAEARLGLIGLREEIARARLSLMAARGSLLDPNLDARCGAKPGEAR